MLQGQVIDVGPLMNGFQVTRPPSSIGVRPRRRQHSPCARAWSSVQRAFPGWVYAALKFGESTIPKGPRNRFGNLRKAPKTNDQLLELWSVPRDDCDEPQRIVMLGLPRNLAARRLLVRFHRGLLSRREWLWAVLEGISNIRPGKDDGDEDHGNSSIPSTLPRAPPLHHHSPYLGRTPDTSILLERSAEVSTSSYRAIRTGSQGFHTKKLSGQWLRSMPVLLLLSLVAIVPSFVWCQTRPNLDLNLLRGLDNHLLDGFTLHNISAPDGSIYASFVGIGASLQSLFVKDRHGTFRDIVLGYDNTSQYLHHPYNPRFGSIVGRYANRIKNSSFVIPGHPNRLFHTTPNEHGGLNTLHGGDPGWDRRPFTVDAKNSSYISFSLVDKDGEQGFPSEVTTKIEYQLLSGGKWKTKMTAKANGPTPIMLSSHAYWNLDAYVSCGSASKHYLQLNAPQYIATDSILIPTGELQPVKNTPLDFTQPTEIGSRLNQTVGLCGQGCTGYDNALVYQSNRPMDQPVMSMWSPHSGIKMSVITDQLGVQIYSCTSIHSLDGSYEPIPRKKSHEGPHAIYENMSCIAIEQQGLIDGINHLEWNIDNIYGPDKPYEWNAIYEFSTI
ncbi:hypothetical protein PCASD_01569 [Puccinia coronata f. sp. avenae]|uniref:Aldose 1-epimerase n=1 Tax=Puccinia coronata f. sp. avenae TaxID=200324 RepID=A0A2N5VIC3_9BASI|nr:hypothetical protein PCASD_01569 [Puccinia coronata f. sp. avenae]